MKQSLIRKYIIADKIHTLIPKDNIFLRSQENAYDDV